MYKSVENFVAESERVMVSGDGSLYFAWLSKEDELDYACNLIINEFRTGHYGPFFKLKVDEASSKFNFLQFFSFFWFKYLDLFKLK